MTYFTMELKIIYKYMITTTQTVKYNVQYNAKGEVSTLKY